MPPHAQEGQQGNWFAFFAACPSGPAPAKLPYRNRQMEDSTQPRTTIIPITLRANQRLELVMPDGPLKAWRADVSMCSRNVLQSAWGGRMTNATRSTDDEHNGAFNQLQELVATSSFPIGHTMPPHIIVSLDNPIMIHCD